MISFERRRKVSAAISWALKCLAIVAALYGLYVVYYTYVYVHFELGARLHDAGWFAFLFAQMDPWMANPSFESAPSYYAHHLSPLIYLWSLPMTGVLGLAGYESFAVFYYAAGAGLLASFLMVGMKAEAGFRTFWLAWLCAVGLLFANEHLFEAIRYPHFEIMFVGLTTVMFAALLREQRWLAGGAALLLILLREDGGFYAAYVVLTYVLTRTELPKHRALIGYAGSFTICVVASVTAILIKAYVFPEFPTFTHNFSGDGFSHVTQDLMLDRLRHNFTTSGTGAYFIWVGCATVVGLVGFRALTPRLIWVPLLLMSPLLILHMLAARIDLGEFRVYYALPFAIMSALTLLGFCDRLEVVKTKPIEIIAALALVAVSTVDFQHYTSNTYSKRDDMRAWFSLSPQVVVPNYLELIHQELAAGAESVCVSSATASLDMSLFQKDQIIEWWGDVSNLPTHCMTFLYMRNDTNGQMLLEAANSDGFVLDKTLSHLSVYRKPLN